MRFFYLRFHKYSWKDIFFFITVPRISIFKVNLLDKKCIKFLRNYLLFTVPKYHLKKNENEKVLLKSSGPQVNMYKTHSKPWVLKYLTFNRITYIRKSILSNLCSFLQWDGFLSQIALAFWLT